MLVACSSVLHAMLRADLVEGRTQVISLEDASIATVGRFITWLYSGSIVGKRAIDDVRSDDVTTEALAELYVFADKYDILRLRYHILHCLYQRFDNWAPPEILANGGAFQGASIICANAVKYIWENTPRTDPIRTLIENSLVLYATDWSEYLKNDIALLTDLPPELLALAFAQLAEGTDGTTDYREILIDGYENLCDFLGHKTCDLEK